MNFAYKPLYTRDQSFFEARIIGLFFFSLFFTSNILLIMFLPIWVALVLILNLLTGVVSSRRPRDLGARRNRRADRVSARGRSHHFQHGNPLRSPGARPDVSSHVPARVADEMTAGLWLGNRTPGRITR